MTIADRRAIESTPSVDNLKARQDLYNGFGEAFSRAFEFVMTPVLLGAIGWLLDRTFGTTPLFILVLAVFGLVGVGAKMYYTYKADMQVHEQGAPWSRVRPSDADPAAADEQPRP
jgi:F0F1-type ATP synthase assembly protein I